MSRKEGAREREIDPHRDPSARQTSLHCGERRGLEVCQTLLYEWRQLSKKGHDALGALSNAGSALPLSPHPLLLKTLGTARKYSSFNDRTCTMWSFSFLLFWGEYEPEWGSGESLHWK